MDDLIEWVLSTIQVDGLEVPHGPINCHACIQHLVHLTEIWNKLFCLLAHTLLPETVLHASTHSIVAEARVASIDSRLKALIAIERPTLKPTRLLLWIIEFLSTVDLARVSAAVSAIPVALNSIVLPIAGSIANPDTHTLNKFTSYPLGRYILRYQLAVIVSIINQRWLREHIVWEHLRVWSTKVTIRHCINQENLCQQQ